MKKCFVILIATSFLSACASPTIITPLSPPMTEKALRSEYRKTKEVILVSCISRVLTTKVYDGHSFIPKLIKNSEEVSIVETTDSGERFEMFGCYGNKGDRFKISY